MIHPALNIKAAQSSIGNHEIYIIQSGVGLVNATLTTSYAIDTIKPNAILLLGVAGAVTTLKLVTLSLLSKSYNMTPNIQEKVEMNLWRPASFTTH